MKRYRAVSFYREVGDVAIVTVVARHISFFELTLSHTHRRHHCVICTLREMKAIVVIQLISTLRSTAVNA